MTASPDAVAAAALACVPGLGPRRLGALLASHPTPSRAWEACARDPAWRAGTQAVDLRAVAEQLEAHDVRVLVLHGDGYPAPLLDDPDPPAVLFARSGRDGALDDAMRAPRVAIVGTRRCTSYGRDVAARLGRQLAEQGVVVVSGLALGIDGAAHEGALSAAAAPPVAVVGSGLDVVYPRRHRRLWERVAESGALLSEAPPGARPEPWRFPLRNRIIAGLADVVVVVESHAAGGSMHTVGAAIERGVPVMAVPGAVTSPSSAGANRLLAEGAAPVLDVGDILVALALEARPAPPAAAPEDLDGDERRVLDAVDWTPTATDAVLARTNLDLGRAAAVLTRLEMRGLLRACDGWWERRGEVR